MLSSIQIKNFQAHKKLRIDFDPNVTTIGGRSDVGKSSIVRAIRWALLNQPRGSDFCHHDEDSVAVKITIDETSVVRSKNSSKNKYQLENDEYVSFGSGVPDPVQKVLRVDEINFQGQHDPPFWLSLSDAEVARKLNEIADLQIIDSSLQRGKALRDDAKKERSRLDAEVELLRQEQESLEWVDSAARSLQSVDDLRNERDALLTRMNALSQLVLDMTAVVGLIDERKSFLEEISPVGSLVKKILDLQRRKVTIKNLVEAIEQKQETSQQEIPDYSEIDDSRSKLKVVSDRIKSLRSIVDQIESQREFLESAKKKEEEANLAIGQVERCPLCERPF